MDNFLSWHKIVCIWLLGFISGFLLLLSGSTLNFWLASNKIDKSILGFFSIVSIPYAINFLWAPFFDKIIQSLVGKIISILTVHMCLAISLLAISLIKVNDQLPLLAALAFFISFFSATQDLILGSFRSEILTKKQHGQGGGIYYLGYRIGMIISGSVAIYVSSFISWKAIYQISALVIVILSCLLCYFIRYYNNFDVNSRIVIDNNETNIFKLFTHLGKIKVLVVILSFLVLYRLADNLINQMMNPFLLELGYSSVDIATTGKLWGTIGTIIGGFIASVVMTKITISKSLLYFGLQHALAHLFLILQYFVGKNYIVLFCTITVESVTCGMSMSAYMALITTLCSGKYRATQYSLLTSMMGISRSLFPTISGIIVNIYGWYSFFFVTTLLTIPSLFLIPYISNIMDKTSDKVNVR